MCIDHIGTHIIVLHDMKPWKNVKTNNIREYL